jgi:hypothetical protein
VRRGLTAAIAVVLAIEAAAGCGGTAEGDPAPAGREYSVRADTVMTTETSVTKASFVSGANDLCRREWPNVLHNFTKYSGWQSPRLGEATVFAKAVRLSYMPGVDYYVFDEIHAMPAPPNEKGAIEEVIGTMQSAVERGEGRGGEPVPIPSRAKLQAMFADYNRLAHRYGLDECLIAGAHLPHTGHRS